MKSLPSSNTVNAGMPASASSASVAAVDVFSGQQVGLYAVASFMVVTVLGMLMYVTCLRRYRLNWFEKNLLENARESGGGKGGTGDAGESGDGLAGVNGAGGNQNQSDAADTHSLRSQCNRSPVGSMRCGLASGGSIEDPAFWVPATVQRQMDAASLGAADESVPPTPSSPTGSQGSAAFSIGSAATGGSIPIVRSDRHVVLSSVSPARPKVASMQAKLDPTKIDTTLYDSKPVVLEPLEPEENHGMVHVSLLYDLERGILTVRLHEALDLQPRDFSGTADPYAKVRFLPHRENVWQTRIHKRTLNPVFDEDFVFEQKPATINRHGIEILLYDFDAYSRHVCIGGCQLDLANIDLSMGNKVSIKMPLSSCADYNQPSRVDLGDLMVSMSYLPSAERATVIVMKARNLRVIDDTRNSSDPYVKVVVWLGDKKLKKRKTSVYRNTLSPTFNEALQFDVGREQLKHCVFEFLVIHDSLLDSGTVLGRVLVGNSAEVGTDERAYFQDVLRTKTAQAQWLPLSENPEPPPMSAK